MKLAKITVLEDGKSFVEIKDSLFDEWHWGNEFDSQRDAINYSKSQNCIFTFVNHEKN